MTYICLKANESKTRANLQNAMRIGRTVASADGSITSFHTNVNGVLYGVGDIVPISPGTSVTFTGKAIAASPNSISSVRVYAPDNTYTTRSVVNGQWNWTTPGITQDTWYRVELRTTDINGITYVTYTNPIIIDVR